MRTRYWPEGRFLGMVKVTMFKPEFALIPDRTREYRRLELTGCGPGDRGATVSDGCDLINLEPDVAAAVPSRDVPRRFGHVDIDNLKNPQVRYIPPIISDVSSYTWVVDVIIGGNANLGSSSDINGGSVGVSLGGVAAEVRALNIGDLR